MSKSVNKKTLAIKKDVEIEKNPDPGIDRDLPGYPHHPSSKADIKGENQNKDSKKK